MTETALYPIAEVQGLYRTIAELRQRIADLETKCDTLKHCPQHKIRRNIGIRICGMLKGTSTGQTISRILRLCGYRIPELKTHLEKQFLPGMSWANYGRTGWHIDHIVPASAFDQTDDEQFAICWSLANLRPTWAAENIKKSNHHHFLL